MNACADLFTTHTIYEVCEEKLRTSTSSAVAMFQTANSMDTMAACNGTDKGTFLLSLKTVIITDTGQNKK